ncbi:MAG: hypothetical protein IPO33_02900 [Saprospiraceae bacterium]|nr:hypothetical protein [Candidatus Brachybacter algidus]
MIISNISTWKEQRQGFATRHGVDHSSADYTIYTDVDFPYLDENVLSVYTALLSGSDLVLATRNQIITNRFHRSAWISRNFRSAVKMLFNIPTTDTQAGLKGLSLLGKRPCWIQKLTVIYLTLNLLRFVRSVN